MSFQSLHLKGKIGKLEDIKRKAAKMVQEVDWLPYKQRFKRLSSSSAWKEKG